MKNKGTEWKIKRILNIKWREYGKESIENRENIL